ncbi:MAG: TonB-dependent receptor, partial [bacterium]|nr:TonB-dependent receptor [bacterium]
PTSVSVLSEKELQDDNITSLDESLESVPGIHIVSGQVNIRGSSGYSRGTGSRVLLLIDGFPSLSADNAEVKWDAIPLDQIARVEIIKGAGSALYGTGALGGIINIITRDPSPVPQTRFRLLGGAYSDPTHPEWDWTSSRRYTQSLDLSHSRQSNNLGVILGLGQKRTNGYKENNWYKRYSGFGKLRYAFKPTTILTATANWARDDHGVFIQWKDRNEPLEVPANSSKDKTLSDKFNLNLDFYHLLGSQTGYRIKTFAYRTNFNNEVEGETGSTATKLGQELQLDLQPNPALSLTLGTEWIADRVRSSPTLFGNHNGLNLAAYVQAELEPKEGLSLSAGGRFDRARTDNRTPEKSFSPKLGLSYRLTPQTGLRSTLGWGFRSPSIAEIYTNATFSAVPIVPNIGLSAEHSLSWEAGLNHSWNRGLHLDLAVFWSRYRDLVEARPNASGVVSFRNVSKGRSTGLETACLLAFFYSGCHLYLCQRHRRPPRKKPASALPSSPYRRHRPPGQPGCLDPRRSISIPQPHPSRFRPLPRRHPRPHRPLPPGPLCNP